MSHNPTYDPEPGYTDGHIGSYDGHTGSYRDGDRSGASTPPNFYKPAPDSYYTNMASYRQATTGPPQSDISGNGKSYRYATEATIPEDEDEADHSHVADSRQVQFSERGPSVSSKKSGMSRGGGGDKRFMILVIVAIILAVLWVIFMGLYLGEIVNKPAAAGGEGGAKTGPSVGGPDNGGGDSKPTEAPVTTTMSNTISSGEVDKDENGKAVMRYTLTNDNNAELELLSIGARVNKLTVRGKNIVVGFPAQAGANLTAFNDYIYGAIDGPKCGQSGNTMHQINYDSSTDESTGEVMFTTTVSGMVVTVTYSLSNDDKVKVEISAKPSGNAKPIIDLCSSMYFKLTDGDRAARAHSLIVNAYEYYDQSGRWTKIGGIFDLTKDESSALNDLIEYIDSGNTNTNSIDYDYRLIGAPGLRHAAKLEGSNTVVNIHTNQQALRFYINLVGGFLVKGNEDYGEQDYIGLMSRNLKNAANNQLILNTDSEYMSVTVYTMS